jgi:hypothetical protein
MSSCFICQKGNAEVDAIIELPAPEPTIQTKVMFVRDSSPKHRRVTKICEDCRRRVENLPWPAGLTCEVAQAAFAAWYYALPRDRSSHPQCHMSRIVAKRYRNFPCGEDPGQERL